MPAGRHFDSFLKTKSRRVCLCSRFPCGLYGAGSPAAVVFSRELVICGNGDTMPLLSEYTRPCVSSLHIGSLPLCAFFVSCLFRRESVLFPGRISILLGFSEPSCAPAPLCDHGLLMFDKSWCETTTTILPLVVRICSVILRPSFEAAIYRRSTDQSYQIGRK